MTALLEASLMQAPVVQGVKGTLLDVVADIPGRPQWMNPSGLYTSLNCISVGSATDICSPGSKDFESPTVIDGFQFSIYTGFTCKSVGLDWSEIETQVAHISEARESVPVESQFMLSDAFQNATDLTPAAGATPEVGLALLEADMAGKYGTGIIHMPRVIAGLMVMNQRGGLDLVNDKLYTRLGTPVAAGGGYDIDNTGPGGDTPAAGDYWMWATGIVQLARSPWVLPGAQINKSTNDMTVLAERSYIGSVDCYAAAVKVSI